MSTEATKKNLVDVHDWVDARTGSGQVCYKIKR